MRKKYYHLLMILIEPVFKMGKNYYPQIFLEECKQYVVKENKISKFINDELEISSSDEASEE